MKDEYLIWKRLEDDCKRFVEQAEDMLFLNKNLLLTAVKHIKQLERAGKVPKNAGPKAGQVAEGSPKP